ncbi:MAG: 30S ribosomal protein S8 [Nitrospiraceae bacterium]
MVTDPIADLLNRIRNAAQRGHDAVVVPASRMKGEILRILKEEGFIGPFEKAEAGGHPAFKIELRYVEQGRPVIAGTTRISRPGRRVYVGKLDVPKTRGGLGVTILSTSKGVMTERECRRAGLGGEVLCSVW